MNVWHESGAAHRLRGRVLAITGAGISAESHLPTFRGRDGHWRRHDPLQLATPEAFARDPALVWEWYRERRERVRQAEPNPAHRALAQLGALAAEHLVVTQNVDDLHERGGTPPASLVHVHGEIFVTRCSACAYRVREHSVSERDPCCPACAARLRPGVVWFGETLDPLAVARVERFLARPVDLVLAIGTTATFGYIVDWMTRSGMLVEVNPEATAASEHAALCIRAPAGTALPEMLAQAGRP